ncbi:TRAP transporter small permease [Aquimarina sp. RZ0]|uniref:TRAP transporter small permease n=1 Tax=Aquimarina sp. RZ0 TaxID=2607730 RepID=UPI0011F0FC65|nr:TRAP transporter small permease [Aquimarina sp. RZ0]KAA1243454.1 TRAP transporter small permease [Aquimarina sp. RZ0]
MKKIRKIQRGIGIFLKAGTILSTLSFIITTLIQIYGRFFMAKAPSWTEEAARLFFVFAIAFSSGLAMKGNFYVYFDFIFQKFSGKWQDLILKVTYICIILLFTVFSVYGLLLVGSGWQEQSPSMKFPMGIAFISMPLLGLSITLYAIVKMIMIFKTKK